ncbi:MAG: OmpA family protein [Polyangiaceae bacterium]|nr:OmpA family protein [Polyangiaceae bacterium]
MNSGKTLLWCTTRSSSGAVRARRAWPTPLSRRCAIGLSAAAAISITASAASAQENTAQSGEFSVQRMESAPGPNNILSVERVRMVEQFGWSASVLFNYAREPFVVVSCVAETNCDEPNASQVEDVPVVQNMFQWDVMGSFNPIEWMQIGLRVPLAYVTGSGIDTTSGQPLPDGARTFGLGDVMVEGKFRFFGDATSVAALGGAVDVSAPLGHVTAENSYIGNDAPVTVGWRGIADFQVDGFFTSVNLRGVYRGENTLGTTTVGPVEFRYGVGLGYQITPIIKVMAEGFGSTQFSSQNGTNTLEADGVVVLSPLSTGLDISAGGGAGILEGVGVPLFRVIGGVSFKMEAGDEDGDGIGDNSDQCPTIAEDKDGFQDDDGCLEDDNDRDGIVDAKDQCKDKSETINGYKDEDGCPDTVADSDADGIPDTADKCPALAGKVRTQEFYGCPDTDEDGVVDPKDQCKTEKEDTDGFEDLDGCPEADNDKDGVPDESDECSEEPEVKNGFKDEDGCPDETPDTDKDGISDNKDKCPKVAENFNGFEDEDGCPDKGASLVEVKQEEIKILQRVEFETGSDKIKGAVSFSVLDAVAGALKANQQIFMVEVAGHTDNAGNADFNKELSQKRADAVMKYLVGKGVEPARLRAVGYGQDKPIGENATNAGKQKNRRVEFNILHSTTKKAAPGAAPAPTPPAAAAPPAGAAPPATQPGF